MKKLFYLSLLIVTCLFLTGCGGKNTVEYGKELTVNNKTYNLTFSIGDVQKGVQFEKTKTLLSAFDFEGTYTKVKVTIKNNSNEEAKVNYILVPMNLMDSSKNKLTSCNYGANALDSRVDGEKLVDTIPANSTISGYVYCKTDSNAGDILNINVPTGSSQSGDGYTLLLDEYYFKLS